MNIPSKCNSVINHEPGDGFTKVKCTFFDRDDIVICRSPRVKESYNGSRVTAISVHQLKKMKPTPRNRVVLDMQLPRQGTQSLVELGRFCRGKLIVFVNPPHDLQAMSSALHLLSHTKSNVLRQVTFSMYVYKRKLGGYYRGNILSN